MKTIKIKDYYGIYQEIPVSDELYEEWRALQNETQRVHRNAGVDGRHDRPVIASVQPYPVRPVAVSCAASSGGIPVQKRIPGVSQSGAKGL